MTSPHLWKVGAPSPDPDVTAFAGAGWHIEPGLLLVCDDVTADDVLDFDSGRVHLTAAGPIVALTLQGRDLAIDFLAARRDDDKMPEWSDPARATQDSRASFVLVLVDLDSQLVVGMRGFTVSPHLTRALQTETLARWAEPVTDVQLIAASQQWQHAYPDRAAVRAGAIASSRIGD